jgi:hypothetical protein
MFTSGSGWPGSEEQFSYKSQFINCKHVLPLSLYGIFSTSTVYNTYLLTSAILGVKAKLWY